MTEMKSYVYEDTRTVLFFLEENKKQNEYHTDLVLHLQQNMNKSQYMWHSCSVIFHPFSHAHLVESVISSTLR